MPDRTCSECGARFAAPDAWVRKGGAVTCSRKCGYARRRATAQRGERADILRDSRSQSAIAADYGVTQTTISAIKRRVAWRHVAALRAL